MKITGDLIGKIIVILLIAVFLGLTLVENKSSSNSSASFGAAGFGGGMPGMGGGMPSGGSMPSGAPSGSATGSATADASGKASRAQTAGANASTGDSENAAAAGAPSGMPSGMPSGAPSDFSGAPANGSAPSFDGATAGGSAPSGGFPGMNNASASSSSSSTSSTKTVTVNCKTVEPETLMKTVRVSGDVASKTKVSAYAITSGKVTSIVKNVGDTVQKGDVIAWIDPSKPGSTYAASSVTAPISGTIISLNAAVGDTVSTQQAFAVIGSVKDLTLTVYVSEKYSASLRVGLPAFISVTSAPDETFEARVTAVSPVVNSTNRTVAVTLDLVKYDSRIKPGMYAGVKLAIDQVDNALVVPNKALHDWNDKKILYVIDSDNVARRVIVETGLTTDFESEIISGLSAGDRVITAGSVADGTPIRIAEGN